MSPKPVHDMLNGPLGNYLEEIESCNPRRHDESSPAYSTQRAEYLLEWNLNAPRMIWVNISGDCALWTIFCMSPKLFHEEVSANTNTNCLLFSRFQCLSRGFLHGDIIWGLTFTLRSVTALLSAFMFRVPAVNVNNDTHCTHTFFSQRGLFWSIGVGFVRLSLVNHN